VFCNVQSIRTEPSATGIGAAQYVAPATVTGHPGADRPSESKRVRTVEPEARDGTSTNRCPSCVGAINTGFDDSSRAEPRTRICEVAGGADVGATLVAGVAGDDEGRSLGAGAMLAEPVDGAGLMDAGGLAVGEHAPAAIRLTMIVTINRRGSGTGATPLPGIGSHETHGWLARYRGVGQTTSARRKNEPAIVALRHNV
jgi:hypothetical protein